VVNLPSFDSGNSSAPTLPGRSSVKGDQGPAITIVATSRSGGAFDFYGRLPGQNYTVYVDTSVGTVVMQFAEVDPNGHAGAGALTGPERIRTDLPTGLPRNRMVIKCKLSATGNLTNLQVLEPGSATMTAKIIAALPNWKFRPARRGEQPVEVNAILGFNINTDDRY
jgi:TonB family protein